jgi:hypothetical protein
MRIRDNFLFDVEGKGGGGEGGDGGGNTVKPETFSREYVTELRNENKTWRTRAQALETETTTARTAAETAQAKAAADIEAATKKATTEATERVTKAEAAANARVIRAEVRAAAVKLGMVDLDAIKMLDTTALKLNAEGDIEGVDALLEATKKAKPYLFGSPSTSSTQKAPDPKPETAKKASEMTDEEFNAAMRNKSWRNK